MRRLAAVALLLGITSMPLLAFAQEDGPVVDVLEIAGIIDRPIERYLIERIDAAEEAGADLVVLQVDSLGGLKIADGEALPPIVRRIRDSRVPVLVYVGPRDARASGVVVEMLAAAHVGAVGLSARVGPASPADHAHPDSAPHDDIVALAGARGRTLDPDVLERALGASASVEAGLADVAVAHLSEALEFADGRRVLTSTGEVTIAVPEDETTVRFLQPGLLRRLLHTFSNPTLTYLLLVAGACLLVFELFQPGFGVAGWTSALLLAGGAYGITALPMRWYGLALLVGGLALLALDVAVDGLGVPTIGGTIAFGAGSFLVYPGTADPVALSPWLVGATIVSVLIFFVPAMTVVRRARQPIAREAKAQLIGEPGQVRSMLNPEGFVLVGGEVWRARTGDGSRMRVGEDVIVESVEGTLLIVRGA